MAAASMVFAGSYESFHFGFDRLRTSPRLRKKRWIGAMLSPPTSANCLRGDQRTVLRRQFTPFRAFITLRGVVRSWPGQGRCKSYLSAVPAHVCPAVGVHCSFSCSLCLLPWCSRRPP